MAQNKLTDLRNHLFAQLERLNDEELTADQAKLDNEISKAKAIRDVSMAVIESAKVEVDYLKAIAEVGSSMSTDFIPTRKELNGGDTTS